MTVDYLSRYARTKDASLAFDISLRGARVSGRESEAEALLGMVDGLDDQSIEAALKLVTFDVFYRAAVPEGYAPEFPEVDLTTVRNVREMVRRTQAFVDRFGPVTLEEPDFSGAYTERVTNGDADMVTKDGLWDVKVSKSKPTSKHTLQVLIYWRLGMRSIHDELREVSRIGIFNPRLNEAWYVPTEEIPAEVIETVDDDVIDFSRPLVVRL